MLAEPIVRCACRLGEGPLWDARSRRLLWVDIDAGEIHALDPRTVRHEVLTPPEPVTALAPRRLGGYLATTNRGFANLDLEGGVRLAPLGSHVADGETTRMNDGKCDRAGRFWAGSMTIDAARAELGALYRLDPDGSLSTVLDGVSISNGLDWSPDGKTMYYVDSGAEGIDCFDFDAASGTVARRRRLVDIPRAEGLADGLTVDTDGCIWVAVAYAGCVRRYSPAGELVEQVDLPTTVVTSCCFGGDDLTTLYITTAAAYVPAGEPDAGALFAVEPGACGQAASTYGGC